MGLVVGLKGCVAVDSVGFGVPTAGVGSVGEIATAVGGTGFADRQPNMKKQRMVKRKQNLHGNNTSIFLRYVK